MRPRLTFLFALLLSCPLAAGTAVAGGQYAGDNGSLAAQRAGAFAAHAGDATALYYNPAALYKIGDQRQVFLGVNVVSFEQSYRRSGSYSGPEGKADYIGDPYPMVEHDGPVQPVPFVAAAFTTGKIGFGIGVFAPHGYGKRSYPDQVRTASGALAPAPQRYDTVSQEGVIALPSAGLSYAISDKITVGARASYGFAQVASRRFAQGLPNDAEDPAADTDALVQVEDRSVITWGAGLHVHASPTWELGAAYSAPIRIDAVGTTATVLGDDLRNLMPGEETRIEPVPDNMAQCAPGGQVGAIMTCVDLVLPQTATVGVRWIARDDSGAEIGDIEVDIKWENWAAADEMNVQMDGVNSAVETPVNPTVIRHGYQDVYSVRIGGSTRLGSQRTTIASFGVGYESAAAPDSWSRLDVDTAERFSAAAGMSFVIGRARLDIGAAIIDPADRHVYDDPAGDTSDMNGRVQPDIPVPLSGPNEQPYNPFNAGRYAARYLIGSVGLAMSW